MMPAIARQNVAKVGHRLDLLGFAAFTIFPAVALYQGFAQALGQFPVLSPNLVILLPLLVIGMAALMRLPTIQRRFARPAVRRATIYLLLYIVVIFVSTVFAYLEPIEREPNKMLQQFAATGAASLVFLVMIGAPSRNGSLRSLGFSLSIWAIAAVLTPLSAFTPLAIGEVQGDFSGSTGLRSFGVLGDGGTFVVSFLTVAFFASRRFLWLGLALIALVVAGSRSPLLVAAVGIALMVVLSQPSGGEQGSGSRAIRVVLASAVAAGLLIALQVLFAALSQRFGAVNAFDRITETQFTESDRFFSIVQGWEWFQLSPIYGNGFNAYYYYSMRSAAFGANQSNALNQSIQTLVDGGIAAFVFLVLFFVEAVRPARGMMVDRSVDPYAIRIWLVAFLLINQTAVFIGPASGLTVLVFGAAGSLLYMREAASEALEKPLPSAILARVPAK